MRQTIQALDAVILFLRNGFGLVLLVAAGLATLAWAVRTRRVQPFGTLGKIARSVCDPLIAPVERRIARFGGSQAMAPWWALLALLVLGALGVGILEFLRDALVASYYASSQGPRGLIRLVVSSGISLLQLALIVRVIISWVGGTYSMIGRIAIALTEWMLAPLRRVLPRVGMVDLSPLVAYFALMILRGLLLGAL